MAAKINGTLKKRVQSLMALNGRSYEDWLNEQHQNYLNEQSDVIDRLLKRELELQKQEQKPKQVNPHNQGGPHHEKQA